MWLREGIEFIIKVLSARECGAQHLSLKPPVIWPPHLSSAFLSLTMSPLPSPHSSYNLI